MFFQYDHSSLPSFSGSPVSPLPFSQYQRLPENTKTHPYQVVTDHQWNSTFSTEHKKMKRFYQQANSKDWCLLVQDAHSSHAQSSLASRTLSQQCCMSEQKQWTPYGNQPHEADSFHETLNLPTPGKNLF